MIRMKVCQNGSSWCEECGRPWGSSSEMYTMKMFGEEHDICKPCADAMFRKLLRASSMYDGKVKTKEDKERKRKEEAWNAGGKIS